MAKFLLISNGHGEDLSGSLLGIELTRKGHQVEAFPLVGKGNAYRSAQLRVLGLQKEFSTGGLGYTSFLGRLTELIQGQLFYLLGSIFRLFILSKRYDLLIVIGDVVPIVATWLTNQKVVVYLVAYSSHYEGRLRLPWPVKDCLKSKRFLQIFSRDQLTADDLQIQLNRSVLFLGNPFMDSAFSSKKKLPEKVFRLGLLPGSRRPELDNNLLMILSVMEYFPKETLLNKDISFDMALVSSLNNTDLINLVNKKGWELIEDSLNMQPIILKKGFCTLNIYRDSFSDILQSSDVLLCMAGTAAEQAVGLGKPVIQLPGKGPQFTSLFAEAQRRLLGQSVLCAEKNNIANQNIFLDTANLILDIQELLNKDSEFKETCLNEALLRLGEQGGTKRIVEFIDEFLLATK